MVRRRSRACKVDGNLRRIVFRGYRPHGNGMICGRAREGAATYENDYAILPPEKLFVGDITTQISFNSPLSSIFNRYNIIIRVKILETSNFIR